MVPNATKLTTPFSDVDEIVEPRSPARGEGGIAVLKGTLPSTAACPAAAGVIYIGAQSRTARDRSPRIRTSDGRHLSSIFEGAIGRPEERAYFATSSMRWKENVRYPACYLRSAGPSQGANPSRLERWRVAMAREWPRVRELVYGSVARAEVIDPTWAPQSAPCPGESCQGFYCSSGDWWCGCIQVPVQCGDGGYCTTAYGSGCQ